MGYYYSREYIHYIDSLCTILKDDDMDVEAGHINNVKEAVTSDPLNSKGSTTPITCKFNNINPKYIHAIISYKSVMPNLKYTPMLQYL